MDSSFNNVSIHDPFFRFTQFWVQYLFYTILHKTNNLLLAQNNSIKHANTLCLELLSYVNYHLQNTNFDQPVLACYIINRLLNQSINQSHISALRLTCVVNLSLTQSCVYSISLFVHGGLISIFAC